MDSKEMGLVPAQKLLGLKDLHYGFWEDSNRVSIENFFAAQERYSDLLSRTIEKAISFNKDAKMLDAGCGVREDQI